MHAFSNRFVDTDIWLHDCERWARGASDRDALPDAKARASATKGLAGLPYNLPTTSDAGPRLFRKWWEQTGIARCGGAFGPSPAEALTWEDRTAQFDKYRAHTRTCSHCQGALRRAKLAVRTSPLLALIPAALGPMLPIAARLAGVAAFLAVRRIATVIIHRLEGYGASEFDLGPRAHEPPDPKKRPGYGVRRQSETATSTVDASTAVAAAPAAEPASSG